TVPPLTHGTRSTHSAHSTHRTHSTHATHSTHRTHSTPSAHAALTAQARLRRARGPAARGRGGPAADMPVSCLRSPTPVPGTAGPRAPRGLCGGWGVGNGAERTRPSSVSGRRCGRSGFPLLPAPGSRRDPQAAAKAPVRPGPR
ncbi:hypothetical protein Nmel_013466, partial [Mimus melanotis]